MLADEALDGGARGGREHALGALARGAELALRLVVAGEDILAALLLVLSRDILRERRVEILAAQMRVSRRGEHGEHAVLDLEQGHVEGTAAEVEHEDVLGALHVGARVRGVLLVQAVGERGGGGLVDDAKDVEARDGARVLGLPALRVVEVGRDGDDRLLDGTAQRHLCGFLHLLEHHGGDLLGGEILGLVVNLHLDDGLARRLVLLDGERHDLDFLLALAELAADDALDVEERALGVLRSLALRRVAHQAAVVGEGDPGRRGPVALGVGEDLRLAVLPHGDAGVRGSEVDADDGLDERHIRHLAAVEHLLLLGFAHLGESVVALDVVRVARDAARVGLLRAVEVALLEEGDAEAGVALAPLGFDLDALLRILNRGVQLAHRRVARGAVRVEDCGGWRRGGVGFVSAPARCDRRGARIWVETRGGPPGRTEERGRVAHRDRWGPPRWRL